MLSGEQELGNNGVCLCFRAGMISPHWPALGTSAHARLSGTPNGRGTSNRPQIRTRFLLSCMLQIANHATRVTGITWKPKYPGCPDHPAETSRPQQRSGRLCTDRSYTRQKGALASQQGSAFVRSASSQGQQHPGQKTAGPYADWQAVFSGRWKQETMA